VGPFYVIEIIECHIHDDWYVAGLRGTGSKSIHIDTPIYVPAHRSIEVDSLGITTHIDSWLDRIPWQPLFTCAFAAPAIGIALGTIDSFCAQLQTRVAPYTGIPFRSRSTSLLRLALARAEIDSAELLLYRDLDDLEGAAQPRTISRATQSSDGVLFDVAYGVECCARAVDRLFRGSGGRALYEDNLLQRYFRDMHAVTQHAAADLDVLGERRGRAILGGYSRSPASLL
jgi:4-hydroxyphenylacetate 3-monooxygenase